MLVSIIYITIIATLFILRRYSYTRIKENHKSSDIKSNTFTTIPKLYTIELVLLYAIIIISIMAIGISEYIYSKSNVIDAIFWYMMMAVFAIAGCWSGVLLHPKQFFFTFGEDYIEFMIGLDDVSMSKATKFNYEDIQQITITPNFYIVTPMSGKPKKIWKGWISWFDGSEIFKQRMEELANKYY